MIFQSREVARRDPVQKPPQFRYRTWTFDCIERTKKGDIIQMAQLPDGVTLFDLTVTVERQKPGWLEFSIGHDEDRFALGHRISVNDSKRIVPDWPIVCELYRPCTIEITIFGGFLDPDDILTMVTGYCAT